MYISNVEMKFVHDMVTYVIFLAYKDGSGEISINSE
jgi:hypothetical protein